MIVEIDLPLLLPYVAEIKKKLLSTPGVYEKVVFKNRQVDAAGMQLVAAIKKEDPEVEIEFAPGVNELTPNIYLKILEEKGMVYAPHSGRR